MSNNPFLEESLPIGIRAGASWSDEYAVEVTRTASGQEHRKLVHPYPVRRFSVAYTKSKNDLFDQLMALYHRAYGRFKGFRVQAIDDYSTNGSIGSPTILDQSLTRISAGLYQLQKVYGATGATRTLFKPVAGTTLIAVEPGRARVVSDPSPRQYCVRQGWLMRPGEIAICAPNRVSVQIAGRTKVYDSISY